MFSLCCKLEARESIFQKKSADEGTLKGTRNRSRGTCLEAERENFPLELCDDEST